MAFIRVKYLKISKGKYIGFERSKIEGCPSDFWAKKLKIAHPVLYIILIYLPAWLNFDPIFSVLSYFISLLQLSLSVSHQAYPYLCRWLDSHHEKAAQQRM